jgi:Tfp pilus assembly protein PilF
MEFKKAGNNADALKMLEKVTQLDPGHGYAFFQRGQILESTGDIPGAKKAYEDGILAAQKSGDAHARSELQGALSMIES